MNKMIGFMISVTFLSVACFGGDFNALTDADYSAIMGIEKRLYTIRYSFVTTPPWQQYPAAHIYCTRLGISHSQMADSILTYATQNTEKMIMKKSQEAFNGSILFKRQTAFLPYLVF